MGKARLTIEGDAETVEYMACRIRAGWGPASFDRCDIENLPDPDPDWWPPQPGDIVTVGDHALWMRPWHPAGAITTWITPLNNSNVTDDEIHDSWRRHHDVTLLIRNRKPYP